MATGVDKAQRWVGARPASALRDLLVVGVLLVLLIVVSSLPGVRAVAMAGQLTTVLALSATAVGAMSAIYVGTSGRLSGDPRGEWLFLAISLYSLVGVPAATLGATVRWDEAAVGNARLFAHTAVVVLLFVAARAPKVPGKLSGGSLLVVGLSIATTLACLGSVFPTASLAVTTATPIRVVVLAAWLLSPIPLTIGAYRRGSTPLYRVGLAFEVVAIAHAFRVDDGPPATALDLTFATLRLFGLLVLVAAASQLSRRSLRQVDYTQSEHQEALRMAEVGLAQVAERDHELRNGIAGLVGAASLLTTHAEQTPALHRAVISELTRLETMLRGAGQGPARAHPHGYSVDAVLAEQVALRSFGGMDIQLVTNPDLCAMGSPTVLAQVMTSVLANCAQHAPKNAVRVRARRTAAAITIRISDDGPGVSETSDEDVFSLGVRSAHSTGQGLGLYVSRRLLQAEGATIRLAPRRRFHRAGCTIILELPAAISGHTAQANNLGDAS